MVRERRYYVYILASKSRVIYVGVSGFLMPRVLRHKAGEGGAFTRKYRVHRLVYFQSNQNVGDAIARETEIKGWRREKKVALIHADNPTWEDLGEGWGGPAVMTLSGKAGSSPGLGPGFGGVRAQALQRQHYIDLQPFGLEARVVRLLRIIVADPQELYVGIERRLQKFCPRDAIAGSVADDATFARIAE